MSRSAVPFQVGGLGPDDAQRDIGRMKDLKNPAEACAIVEKWANAYELLRLQGEAARIVWARRVEDAKAELGCDRG